jgi:hypothetical protein
MDGLLGPRRRRGPQPEPVDAASRVATQRHLAARRERLRAYAAALEAAAASRPPGVRRASLERQLARAQGDLRAAERPRLQTLAAPSVPPGADGRAPPGAPGQVGAARPLPPSTGDGLKARGGART